MKSSPAPGGGPLGLLLVTHSLSGGGAERFAATLASTLPRERFAPEVCTASEGRSYPIPPDVTVRHLGYRGLASLPRALWRLRRLIVGSAPDLVLTNVLSTTCLAGAAMVGLRRRPAWVARVGNAPERGDPLLQRVWARRVYPRVDLLVANSRGLLEALGCAYPEVRGRGRAIPNPTDFETLGRLAVEPLPAAVPPSPPGVVQVLWLGRLTPQKRPDLALAALALAREESGRDLRLWLCGDGPLRGAVERRVEELGLRGLVALPGFVRNPFPLMRVAHLFLSTSDFEGLPNALIESQGFALPAVATRCPYGPEEIVDSGATGLLVAPGDTAALAGALAELAGDRERRDRLGRQAAVRARERFGLAAVLPRWQEALLEAAGVDVPPPLR